MTPTTQPTHHLKIDKQRAAQSILTLMQISGLTWDDIQETALPKNQEHDIPEAWKRARGILKDMDIDPVAYQRSIRAEWNHRP